MSNPRVDTGAGNPCGIGDAVCLTAAYASAPVAVASVGAPALWTAAGVGAGVGTTLWGAAATIPSLVGFGSGGIAAGSWAASWMSASAITNGGGVAAGSLIAIGQSIGAAGLAMTTGPAIVVTSVAAAAAGAGMWANAAAVAPTIAAASGAVTSGIGTASGVVTSGIGAAVGATTGYVFPMAKSYLFKAKDSTLKN